jgi:flagellar biogenesis protein FliO
MAFRLPTLTMAVCVAFCVPHLASNAQQPITETAPPIAQVRIGDESDSANPLRHHTVAASNRAPRPSVATKSEPHSSSENLANSMPPAVRRAIFPDLQDNPQQPTVQSVNHLEPVNHGGSTRRVESVKQLQPAIQRDPVNHRDSANQFEPQQTEMAAGFSRLPKPDATSIPLVAASDSKHQTVASLLSTSPKSTDSETTGASFTNKLLDNSSSDDSQPQFQALLQNIAGSTCLVLILGVGFIVVAKRVMKGKLSKTNQNPEELRIHVVANLRLTPKSNLHLIEVGEQRVLVASDSTGIKSVVSLTRSFATALDSLDETVPMEQTPTATENSQESAAYERPRTTGPANAEIEAEMQRKLSEVLGGQAFKDVFYQSTRAVA